MLVAVVQKKQLEYQAIWESKAFSIHYLQITAGWTLSINGYMAVKGFDGLQEKLDSLRWAIYKR